MRVLVAISILAFLALLWAFVAIFRHIRRARRRRRRSLEPSRNLVAPERIVIAPRVVPTVVPEITFTDPEAPIEVNFTDQEEPVAKATQAPPPAHQPYLRQAQPTQPSILSADPTPEPQPTAAAEQFLDTLPPELNPEAKSGPLPPAPRDPSLSPLPAWPHFGFSPARSSGSTEPIPYAAPPSESSTSITPARIPIEIQSPAPAVKPVYPPARPLDQEAPPPIPLLNLHPGQPPIRRADWAYFNKDMGDLSDPAPAGSRPKIRTSNSD